MKRDLNILLVEDDDDFRDEVVNLLGVYNDVDYSGSLASAREAFKEKEYDVIILDKALPDGNGLDLIPEIKEANSDSVVIVLTGDKNYNIINKCLASGASDYVIKSENIVPDLLIRIPLAVGRANLEKKSTHLEEISRCLFKHEIVGKSKAMHDLRQTIQDLKGSKSPVLVIGETGTGKELIARRLNAIDTVGQRHRPFIAVNCGAIPENLIESELFGHVRGTFTGAQTDRIGKFEDAHGGDLFLDEIGELPLNLQTKLLRVIQDGEVTKLGSNVIKRVHVRVIAATNRPLEQMVAEGLFRQDLFYRLGVFSINTEPLRNRPEDIPDLVRFFIVKLAGPKITISEDALKYLSRQEWPGNIRELHNAIERALIQLKRRKDTEIQRQDFVGKMMSSIALKVGVAGVTLPKTRNELSEANFQKFLELAEREYLKKALDLCDGSPTEAASSLGMGRSTIFKKLNQLGLSKVRPKPEEAKGTEKGVEI